MKILFFDSETSGLPLWKEPSSHPGQPHIVQLAAVLLDIETGERNSYQSIVRPNGWTIPDEVAAIHGITTERATAEGNAEEFVLAIFNLIWKRAEKRVAHVETFDARILRIAYKRFAGDAVADAWSPGQAEDTAVMAEPIVRIPATDRMVEFGRGAQFKKPKLIEAYRHFFGRDFSDPHSAMADVMACMEIYLAIKEMTIPARQEA